MKINLQYIPVDNLNLYMVTGTALYGKRKNPVTGKQQVHHGVDLNRLATGAAINKQPVKAVADGTVIASKMQSNGKGYGNYIVINHGSWYTLNAHLNSRKVTVGQKVVAGQIIGIVGTTGSSTGPHLHFGICTTYSPASPDSGSTWVDPLPYLKFVNAINKEQQEEEEMVTETKIKVDGQVKIVKRILKDGENYIRLRDMDDVLGVCKVEYDSKGKIAMVTD